MVRQALQKQAGATSVRGTDAATEVESGGALLLTPDRGVNVGEPYDPPVIPFDAPSTLSGLLLRHPVRA